jgi:hypothetical protein
LGAHEKYAKQRQYLFKDHNETVLYVMKDGHVKAVRIMATVGENLVSIDKDTTSQQPLQTAHQYTV